MSDFRIAALICECNPFHNGHAYIFSQMRRRADTAVAILSGNFVQRGETAVFDKYARARAVLASGADLVLELPFPWCSASAEYFASAGVTLAARIGAEALLFGASSENAASYREAARILADAESESAAYSSTGRKARTLGAASAREAFLREAAGSAAADLMRTPNDILAIEYCKAIAARGANLLPCPVLRADEIDGIPLCGATDLRRRMAQDGIVALHGRTPAAAETIFREEYAAGRYAFPSALAEILFLHLRHMRSFPHAAFAEGAGGVLGRLIAAAASSANADELFARAATKKYTNTRFRRAALFSLMEIPAAVLRRPPAYSVLLAANERGRRLLSQIRRAGDFPILTKPADHATLPPDAAEQYAALRRADELYTLCLHTRLPAGAYLRRTPYIAKSM